MRKCVLSPPKVRINTIVGDGATRAVSRSRFAAVGVIFYVRLVFPKYSRHQGLMSGAHVTQVQIRAVNENIDHAFANENRRSSGRYR